MDKNINFEKISWLYITKNIGLGFIISALSFILKYIFPNLNLYYIIILFAFFFILNLLWILTKLISRHNDLLNLYKEIDHSSNSYELKIEDLSEQLTQTNSDLKDAQKSTELLRAFCNDLEKTTNDMIFESVQANRELMYTNLYLRKGSKPQ